MNSVSQLLKICIFYSQRTVPMRGNLKQLFSKQISFIFLCIIFDIFYFFYVSNLNIILFYSNLSYFCLISTYNLCFSIICLEFSDPANFLLPFSQGQLQTTSFPYFCSIPAAISTLSASQTLLLTLCQSLFLSYGQPFLMISEISLSATILYFVLPNQDTIMQTDSDKLLNPFTFFIFLFEILFLTLNPLFSSSKPQFSGSDSWSNSLKLIFLEIEASVIGVLSNGLGCSELLRSKWKCLGEVGVKKKEEGLQGEGYKNQQVSCGG